MNREAIQKWIDALRSGKYKQCKGRLRRGNRFCASGVLCDIHAKEFDCMTAWKDDRYFGNDVSIPFTVIDWIEKRGILIDIITMNDFGGMNFNQIADEIEKRFKRFKNMEDAQ